MDGSELASSENQVRGYMALCHVLSSDLTRQMGQVQVLPRVWVHVGALELAPAKGHVWRRSGRRATWGSEAHLSSRVNLR
jgi:hypothetical protein